MSILRFFSPTRAYRDLRLFFSRRQPHQMVFATAAVAFTIIAVVMIAHDSDYEPAYHRDVIYFQQWRADRSEGEILAQQKIDQAAKEKREAEIKRAMDERQAEFKKVDDSLRKYGI